MEVIELVVYVFVAVMLGGLVLFMVSSVDESSVEEAFNNALTKEETSTQVSINEFYGVVLSLVDACREESVVRTVVVQEEGVVSKEEFFVLIKQASLCSDVQSAILDCGVREDVDDFVVEVPAIITFSCEEETLKIE